MADDVTQGSGSADDMLQTLLLSAVDKAAKREAQDALEKGFVTRKDINLALAAFGEDLQTKIVTSVQEMLMPKVEEAVQKATAVAGDRKSTIATPEDERETDPIAYLLKKGKDVGPDAYDDVDKRLIWGLTYKALGRGLEFVEEDE